MQRHRVFNFSLFIIYIVGMTGFMIYQGIGLAPDRYIFVLLLASLLVRKTRSFILDWMPFLFILLSYDFLRGFADNLSMRVHYHELINADLALFGYLPTVELQKALFTKGAPAIHDYFFTIIYFLHFALPLSFGFLVWIYNRSYFRQFISGLLILSYAAWITYMIYPAAPPWLAQEKGYISGVTKIMDQTSRAFPTQIDLPTIYHKFNPNPVAAMPSLHAGYPLLVLLFALRFFRKRALYFIPYVISVWFAIVYLGEHYFIDVVFGAVYAVIAYTVAMRILHNVKFQKLILSFFEPTKKAVIKVRYLFLKSRS